MFLTEPDIYKKLHVLDETLSLISGGQWVEEVPDLPGRAIDYLPIHHLQGRMGLSTQEGQQKLLHDLANIELQAMELGVRTLMEFPQANGELREELMQIVQEEAKHLKMCLQALEGLGGFWGQWPVHLGLWHAPQKKDTLLERIFTVHFYLEGSGLDSGDTLLRRLSGVNNKVVKQTVKVIVDEEVRHVAFGEKWFRLLSKERHIDQQLFFKRMSLKLMAKHPRKDKISYELRRQAGFTSEELKILKEIKAMEQKGKVATRSSSR